MGNLRGMTILLLDPVHFNDKAIKHYQILLTKISATLIILLKENFYNI